MEEYHEPVLLKEVIDILKVAPGEWYLDCTLGDGGHSLEILRRGGKVVGIDVDPQGLGRAEKRFKEARVDQSQYILVQGNFRDLKNLISRQTEPVRKFKGILFDLGVSSLQLETPQRGFSFIKSGPLDMRMDPNLGVRALDLINVLSRKELYELFSNLGEEKYSKKLADALVSARTVNEGINTTKDLADLVGKVVGGRLGRIHPATRVFQALRIAVNDELSALKEGLDQAIDLIDKYGFILVISFHSLEDRITKFTFRQWEFEELGRVLTKKPTAASEQEIGENPRSRSAKLRVFRREL